MTGMTPNQMRVIAEWLAAVKPPADDHGRPDSIEELRALLDADARTTATTSPPEHSSTDR